MNIKQTTMYLIMIGKVYKMKNLNEALRKKGIAKEMEPDVETAKPEPILPESDVQEPEPEAKSEPEAKPETKKLIPPDKSVCPFNRMLCLRNKCVLWVDKIVMEEEKQTIDINMCGIVYNLQLQYNLVGLSSVNTQLLTMIHETFNESETEEEESTEEEKEDEVFDEISKKPKLDLDF